ncbi:MAG TPA: hypothetical protein PKH24_11775 [Sedimentisphaerales bacterium]|jgi:hypothetical protein|nr:hypothetical protein [Sedimentisphaerales bacterium]HNU29625.1 hypothetical protein [Sedimentisphaerales bacterium]
MNQPESQGSHPEPTHREYRLVIFVLFYNAIMIVVSCFYHASIFDPVGLLWGFLLLIGGPVAVLIALAEAYRLSLYGSLFTGRGLLPLAAIVSVVLWSLGFWRIGAYCRPKLFGLVAKQNDQRAIEAIRQIEDPNHVCVRGFRYPCCKMPTVGYYRNGALFLVVPSAPGPKDSILFDPNGAVSKEGWEHLAGSWYYYHVSR